MNKTLIAIFSHPELYPPTLYGMERLAAASRGVSLLYRPHASNAWPYPANVRLRPSGPAITVREQLALPVLRRYGVFATFVKDLAHMLASDEPDLVVLYDPVALLAFAIAREITRFRGRVWYHNHDVLDTALRRPLSLGWLALRAERRMFPHLDVFSLPSNERQRYFPMKTLAGAYRFLPNVPSLSLYGSLPQVKRDDSRLTLIFQGSVSTGHGIEELLAMLPFAVRGRPVHMVLKGWYDESFRQQLKAAIAVRGLQDHVELLGFSPPSELPATTARCHVGIAIHTRGDAMNSTLGTASNKIYEYAAVGLPVLYYDNPHFREHLGKYTWAEPTLLDSASLVAALEHIVDDYAARSMKARADFETSLNFEHHFDEALHALDVLAS